MTGSDGNQLNRMQHSRQRTQAGSAALPQSNVNLNNYTCYEGRDGSGSGVLKSEVGCTSFRFCWCAALWGSEVTNYLHWTPRTRT